MSLDAVKARIAKLLNLTEERGASPAEAATAMRLAAEMLRAHELSESECHLPGAAEDAEDSAPLGWQWDYATTFDTETTTTWRGVIAAAIGRTHGCTAKWSRRQDPDGRFRLYLVYFGRRSDADTCAYLLAMACREVDRMARLASKGRGRSYGGAFRAGCASAIAQAFRDEYAAERARHAPGSRALAVLDRYARAQAESGVGTRRARLNGGHGFSDGKQAGGSLNFRAGKGAVGSGARMLGSGR